MENLLAHLSGIRDNHTRGKVADFLKEKIIPGSALSIVSAYFTVQAYDALREALENVGHLRFLFGEPRFARGKILGGCRSAGRRIRETLDLIAQTADQARPRRD